MLSPEAKERQRLLNVRLQMLARCYDPDNPQFKDYGGRGITVCDRWKDSPAAFIEDVWPRPKGMTLDRADNDKGYGPDNFRWSTRAEQVRNRRNSVIVNVRGIPTNLMDACIAAGLPYDAVHKRIVKRGWSAEQALSVPVTRANRGSPRGRVS
jgi:hypothetical protein